MAFSKDNPPPSRRGIPNKFTGAQKDLIQAWNKASGPETALELMKVAIAEAKGKEEPIINKAGEIVGTRVIRNFLPLSTILPYIARKMPETHEVFDGGVLSEATDEELSEIVKKEREVNGVHDGAGAPSDNRADKAAP